MPGKRPTVAERRMLNTVETLAAVWHANDPARSRSKTPAGYGRRVGRRETAVKAIALILDRPEGEVKAALESGVL